MDQDPVQRGAGTRRRRADAERSIEAILDATLECIQNDGDLNMTAIARTAGVSRVTLYAHFPTRAALLEGALHRALQQLTEVLPNTALDEVPAPEALTQLLGSSWRVLARQRNLHAAASAALSPAQLRTHHEPVLGSVDTLVLRGQAAGDFRTDLPREWLITTIYTLLHLAAEELNAGRLAADQAGEVVTATILSLLQPQGDG
jgi:TetR/AcrR family transcriptional regulator, mexCD-oprJ operon repressor